MSEKLHRNRKKSKKVIADMDSLIESDEYFGFIVGCTSNGVPYGLTHEEWNEINSNANKEDFMWHVVPSMETHVALNPGT